MPGPTNQIGGHARPAASGARASDRSDRSDRSGGSGGFDGLDRSAGSPGDALSLERAAAYAIASTKGVGPSAFERICGINASRGRDFARLARLSTDRTAREYRLSPSQAAAIREALRAGGAASGLRDIAARLAALERAGARLSLKHAKGYPAELRDALGPRAPSYLFARGDTSLIGHPCVAVVGTRRPSRWGVEGARAASRAVVAAGQAVVSGYAEGVDKAAHAAALEAEGRTILVLSYGISHYRPTKELEEAERQGRAVVLSQFPPEQVFSTGTAMARNLVVAALAGRVVAIESGRRGGTMETARMALGLLRPLFALRKPSLPATPTGNRFLLSHGAHPLFAAFEKSALRFDGSLLFCPILPPPISGQLHLFPSR